MNLTVSSINPSFGNISKFKKLAQTASDCIARAKCYAEIRTSKDFKPDKHAAKILLSKDPEKLLERYKQFTVKNFRELSPLKYNALKLHTATKFQNEFKTMSDMIEMSEKWLDEKYGKGNWVFVSIGRSLEGLADSLSYKGHDARILPMSGIHHLNLTADEIAHQDDFGIYTRFIKKLGFSKDAIAKDTRHYLFADFCDTGATIQTVKKILKYKLGIDSENVDFKDFTTLYEEAYNASARKRKYTHPIKLEKMLRLCTFKKFCRTDRVECSDLQSVTKAFTHKQPINSKLFHFKLMDAYLPKKLDYRA
ncbi:hypothetical protein IJC60_01790 [bacterium]|nr:hypothetical protein [bacterium]